MSAAIADRAARYTTYSARAGLIGFGTPVLSARWTQKALMIDTFGDEYRRYMARTLRILPGIY